MAQGTEAIKIVIRTTNNKYADFPIEMSSFLTIYDLKQNITLNHPTKPIPKDQRLIYSGKLLDEKNILNQVFIKSNSGSSFMVHLVLDSDKNQSSSKTSQQSTIIKSSIINEESPSSSSHSPIYEQYINELNQYQQQLQQFMLNPHGILSTSNSETQAYSQYCYTHYQMYQNYLAHQRPITSTRSIPIIPTTNNQTTTIPPPANNDEFNEENDLLGMLYIVIEIFLLSSIIYFYSTFNRFLFVVFIFALVYLHCRGYLSMQRHRGAQIHQVPPVVEQAAGNDVEQRINRDTDAEQVQNNDLQLQESPSVMLPETRSVIDNQITPTRLLLTAISTFFSSLIPERPQ